LADDDDDDKEAMLAACTALEKKTELPARWIPARRQNLALHGLLPRCHDGLGKPMRVIETSNA